ncbi:hypothetical protein CC86DRAFT_340624 [Ophiobolus disseminans]|uniref:Med15 multi-domain protein n=1 Tax=Ophiobolus disseminans TaxID=1469910 RepID=A0A6A7AG13_9PLEO|nr:hypothetical protein CC86DRAFT_340624 [Ophiobolus disseminans]
MGKPGLGLFTNRRKSSSNVLDEVTADTAPSPDGYASANADSGGFRLMSRNEVEKANERRKTVEKSTSKFPRFSGFGATGNKGRVQSFEEDSPGSSKRDSKSSSGTQFSSSRPYNNGQHGSTSTLPSSTDTSSDDNLFASAPRPNTNQHSNTPSSSLSMNGFRKQLPSLPKPGSGVSYRNSERNTRDRSMTASSYASTAIPPKLEADLNFGNSTFENMFSDISRKESPELSREAAGRSLLSEKRTFQAEPLRIHPKLDVEPPLKSWESRGSAENLMSSPRSDNDSPPPPPPPHKYSQYAPVASESPTLPSAATFPDPDARMVRKTFVDRNSYRDSSPEQDPTSIPSSSATSLQTPASSRSSNHTSNTTPKASLAYTAPPYADNDDENMFAAPKVEPKPQTTPVRRAPAPTVVEYTPGGSSSSAPRGVNGRVLTQTEYLAMQKRAHSQPPPEDDSDDEDYDDEEEAIRKREEEEIMRRKQQQMHFAREAMRRTTTAPAGSGQTENGADGFGMGFPSETSIKADEWEDEDVPLGILAQHGFPSQTRNRMPSMPANAIPSYIPDRPASAGPMASGPRTGPLPAFARNLPADPHSSFIGGGLVQSSTRESMGFNGYGRGPASVAGDSIAGGMGTYSPMMYQEAGMSQPSLVDQIQMRDMAKPKYMGGASSAKKPQGGPFTGMLGQQMNGSGQSQQSTRMPMMNGMNPMMNPMMGGQMPMMGMGMNQMGYPMPQGNDMMAMQQMQQMQQMIAMQQMQLMAMQQPQSQDPRMSMAMPNNGYGGNMMGNGSFLNVPGAMPNGMGNMQNRPMSFMSTNGQQQQPPMSNYLGPGPGYTPSIAPSERSNIGMSARYRPVANNSDAHSTGTSMTLQASGGAPQTQAVPIKGTIKKIPQAPAEEDEDWSRMAARKNRANARNKPPNNGLEELTKGLNI